ncbi:hypothetical protein Gotri_009270 [Gossypium trilobum]|uniref:GATA-type domain-containing protein n=1 Tax=Gossypium trilobum TaxID=34281 RepID=A0A7J9ELV4_9ROSI|nr:hypothetical protein [Gossypium trilobum]
MTSSNCYSSLYPFPIDLNEDDQHQHHQLFNSISQPSSSSSSSSSSPSTSLTCPFSFSPTVQHQQAAFYQSLPQQFHDDQQDQEKIHVPQDGPLRSDCELRLSIWKKEERVETHHQSHDSAKWMPLKMRTMRKMMSSDHTDLSNSPTPKSEDHQEQKQPSSSPDNNNSTIRVCADCNTTKTPLWRSGPRGPKTPPSMKSGVQLKAKRSSNNGFPHLKNKKCKLNSQSQSRKKLCFEDLRIILSKNSAFHGVFPQDEKEAAILLMALSYGLVHG